MKLKFDINEPFPIPINESDEDEKNKFFKKLKQELVIMLKASSMENRLTDVYLCDSGDNSLFWGMTLDELLEKAKKEM